MYPTAQQNIDPEIQKRLNEPLPLEGTFDPKDEAFLSDLLKRVEKNEINLFTPSSLLKHELYDRLPPDKQAKVDIEAFSTLASLREIVGLYKTYQAPTFQVQNLITKVRLTKEKFEEELGDVFLI